MKHQEYYPGRHDAQASWLQNFAIKLPVYTPDLTVPNPEISGAIDDAKWGAYYLGTWLPAVRTFNSTAPDATDEVLNGSGTSAVDLPTFTTPALPVGATPQNPGVLPRIFAVVAKIKLDAAYTEAMGHDLGIIGTEDTGHAVPKITVLVQQGTGVQVVRIAFFKFGHTGVVLESRRNGGAWELLAIDTESPYMDERPLLTPDTPEVREYRARYWDKGTPNGDWTAVEKVTVSP